jgi:serine/threonine-protein kinase
MVGKKILHYELIDKIGAGGMGEIYKAEDSRLHRLVAVKILSPGLATDPDRKRRFFQEAQAASALNHPNIITLYDIVSEGDMQCIVMEYINGRTLRDLTPAGGLPPTQALQYAAQIASALSAAHAAHIIHRDLKPSNIMVTTSGLIKVLDFGLAKWVDVGLSGHNGEQTTTEAALTREGSIIGTVSYMSPEQAEGKRVDARSDIFSFGSVLYEMLTGKRAFEGRSGISTLSSILRDDVKPINDAAPSVPPALEQIVLRCLPKEPVARWQSMKEIEVALLALQRHLDPEGRFPAPIPSVTTPIVAPPALFEEQETLASPEKPAPSTLVSTESQTAIGPPAPPVKKPGLNGQSGASKPPLSNPATQRGSSASRPPGSRRSKSQRLVVAFGLLAAVLIAGAGATGWYWWKSHQAKPSPVAAVTSPPAVETPPAPATPPPADIQPASPPSVETAPPAPPETAKRTPKANKIAKIVPPVPVRAAPPPPVSVLAPPPSIPTPAPAPVIQNTPVVVNDALPFVINLDQDVPTDAREGQILRFTVSQALQVGNKTVIAKGATVTGTVTAESGKRFLRFRGHKLAFRLTQAEAVDGRKLAVRAIAGKGDGPPTRSFETAKASKIKGYAAVQGTAYIGYIDGDQMVAIRK